MNAVNFRTTPLTTYDMEESMNVLRTNIMYSGAKKQVLLITSPNANDGKSTIAFQLAKSFSQTGQKVLLIDADLRKSIFQGVFGITSADGMPIRGLADLLTGNATADDVIYETPIENLSILLIGRYLLNTTPLLESQIFADLIAKARQEYDTIIIDPPPLGLVIDAAVMAPLCDGVLIVATAGRTDYNSVNHIKKQLLRVNANIIGCVLNKAEHTVHRRSLKKYKSYYFGAKKS